MPTYTETNFEAHIEARLNASGSQSRLPDDQASLNNKLRILEPVGAGSPARTEASAMCIFSIETCFNLLKEGNQL